MILYMAHQMLSRGMDFKVYVVTHKQLIYWLGEGANVPGEGQLLGPEQSLELHLPRE